MASSFRAKYGQKLAELTFNSKPIINVLTMLAADCRQFSDVIVDLILSRVRRDHADARMPVLYVVDSILKNVGGVYVELIEPWIVNLFQETFHQGSADTRRRLLHLLKTWEDARPSIFSVHTLDAIHQQVGRGRAKEPRPSGYGYGAAPKRPRPQVPQDPYNKRHRYNDYPPRDAHARPTYPSSRAQGRRLETYRRSPPRSYSGQHGSSARFDRSSGRSVGPASSSAGPVPAPPQQNTTQLLAIVDQLEARLAGRAHLFPLLADIKRRIALGQPVGQSVAELTAAVRASTTAPPSSANMPMAAARPVPVPPQPPRPPVRARGVKRPPRLPAHVPVIPAQLSLQLFPEQGGPQAPSSSAASAAAAPPPPRQPLLPANHRPASTSHAAAAAPPPRTGGGFDLLQSLSQIGRGLQTMKGSTSAGSGKSGNVPPPLPPHAVLSKVPPNVPRGYSEDPDDPRLLEDLEHLFSVTRLKAPDWRSVYNLYDAFPSQCKSCGLRKPSSEEMAQHLDWHFRMNQREARRAKQALSQDWYLPESEWATHEDVYAKEQAAAPAFLDEEENEEEEQEDDGSGHQVPVPTDGDPQTNCSICSEELEQVWDDDQDQWMYKQAVKTEQGIVHWRCHRAATEVTAEMPKLEADPAVKTESSAPTTPTTPSKAVPKTNGSSADDEKKDAASSSENGPSTPQTPVTSTSLKPEPVPMDLGAAADAGATAVASS